MYLRYGNSADDSRRRNFTSTQMFFTAGAVMNSSFPISAEDNTQSFPVETKYSFSSVSNRTNYFLGDFKYEINSYCLPELVKSGL
ncbi:MAG: hypothetical protein ACHQLA_00075 [Ignavibacteriales bacterium]